MVHWMSDESIANTFGNAFCCVHCLQVTAYGRLQHLQGICIPMLLAAGTLHEGRTAFVALSDAGVSLQDLEDGCDPTLNTRIITVQARSSTVSL